MKIIHFQVSESCECSICSECTITKRKNETWNNYLYSQVRILFNNEVGWFQNLAPLNVVNVTNVLNVTVLKERKNLGRLATC